MFEFDNPIDVIMWMVFVAVSLAVAIMVADILHDNYQQKKKRK